VSRTRAHGRRPRVARSRPRSEPADDEPRKISPLAARPGRPRRASYAARSCPRVVRDHACRSARRRHRRPRPSQSRGAPREGDADRARPSSTSSSRTSPNKRLDRTEAFRRMEELERELLKGAEADAKKLEEELKKIGDGAEEERSREADRRRPREEGPREGEEGDARPSRAAQAGKKIDKARSIA
jgi:hypothetical protein